MTPEERAREALNAWDEKGGMLWSNLLPTIAQAIREAETAARNEEREACAALAGDYYRGVNWIGDPTTESRYGLLIAEAIRARTESEAPDAPPPFQRQENVMVKIGGKSFRCEACRSNVFAKIGENRYQCNGCQATYEGSE